MILYDIKLFILPLLQQSSQRRLYIIQLPLNESIVKTMSEELLNTYLKRFILLLICLKFDGLPNYSKHYVCPDWAIR